MFVCWRLASLSEAPILQTTRSRGLRVSSRRGCCLLLLAVEFVGDGSKRRRMLHVDKAAMGQCLDRGAVSVASCLVPELLRSTRVSGLCAALLIAALSQHHHQLPFHAHPKPNPGRPLFAPLPHASRPIRPSCPLRPSRSPQVRHCQKPPPAPYTTRRPLASEHRDSAAALHSTDPP
ncbi:hypothetical protein IWX90DRAFT_166980 [Phyllosticta citrichinensis]|uniref:Uncharacterized protein n=1 Tax=Phyllosticta citrichinensis TaxID=1130410 RepID=A0ABR1Y0Z2_9PEZI